MPAGVACRPRAYPGIVSPGAVTRPEFEGVNDGAGSGPSEIVPETVLPERGGHLDGDVSFVPVEKIEAHFQGSANHMM